MSDPLTPPPVEPTPEVPTAPAAAPAAAPNPYAAPAYQQPVYQQPGYQPPVVAAAAADFPGKTLGIVAMVLSLVGIFVWFIAPLVGAIMGHVAMNQTKAFGQQVGQNIANTPAKVAIIVGWILVGLSVIGIVIYVIVIIAIVATGVSAGYTES